MKNIILIIAIVSIALVSCDPGNKSIIHKLDVKEVAKLTKKSKTNGDIIQAIELIKTTFIKDDNVVLSKYQDLSYNDIIKYVEDIGSKEFINMTDSVSYCLYELYTDSIVSVHRDEVDFKLLSIRNDIKQNDPSKYLRVNFVESGTFMYSGINVIKEVLLKFKAESLISPIVSGEFTFEVFSKSSLLKTASIKINFTSNINGTGKIIAHANESIENLFGPMKNDEIFNSFSFKYFIKSVKTSSGKKIFIKDIPDSYKYFIDETDLSKDSYLELILDDYEYLGYLNFNKKVFQNETKKLNPLAYDFFHIADRYKELLNILK